MDAPSFVGRVALVGMLAGAAVHAAIVPTHWGDSTVLAVLFIADAVGFVAASVWVLLGGRHWRLVSAGMLGGTVAGYVLYLAKGWETADPVGSLTTGVELVAALMLVMPERRPAGILSVGGCSGRRCRWWRPPSSEPWCWSGRPPSARPTAPAGRPTRRWEP